MKEKSSWFRFILELIYIYIRKYLVLEVKPMVPVDSP